MRVAQNLDVFQRDQAAAAGFIEQAVQDGQERVDLGFLICDFNHDRQIQRQVQKLGRADPAGRSETHEPAPDRGAGQAGRPGFAHDHLVHGRHLRRRADHVVEPPAHRQAALGVLAAQRGVVEGATDLLGELEHKSIDTGLGISPADNTVTVGPREGLRVTELTGIRPTWTADARPGTWRGLVQVRAHGEPMPATITAGADEVRVALDEPAYGIAPGQAAVYYADDLVVGACTVARTTPAAEAA